MGCDGLRGGRVCCVGVMMFVRVGVCFRMCGFVWRVCPLKCGMVCECVCAGVGVVCVEVGFF